MLLEEKNGVDRPEREWFVSTTQWIDACVGAAIVPVIAIDHLSGARAVDTDIVKGADVVVVTAGGAATHG